MRDRAFFQTAGDAAFVFEVRPTTGYAFAKGTYSRTRWRFSDV